MEHSDEIKKLILRFYESLENADEAFWSNLLTKKDGLLMIGSDAREYWTDHSYIVKTLKSQLDQMGDTKVITSDIQAFTEGTVGWSANQGLMKMPDGVEIPFRATGVFHQENGEWKIVQWHASIGIANVEAIGEELEV